jgi:hypothetical protein
MTVGVVEGINIYPYIKKNESYCNHKIYKKFFFSAKNV